MVGRKIKDILKYLQSLFMENSFDSASSVFETDYASILAVVEKRIQLEWSFHRDKNLDKPGFHLIDYAKHFGRMLLVIYRHRLVDALREEFQWYVNVFEAHGWGQDALSLILDSWIVAIQGLIKQPECNVLAEPLQNLRDYLPRLFLAQEAPGTSNTTAFDASLLEALVKGDVQGAQHYILSTNQKVSSPDRLIVDVLLPAIAEIGNRWEHHQTEIYEEHIATHVLKTLLMRLPALRPFPVTQIGRTALVSCAPGDEHDLIPLALSSYLEAKGWAVKNLGRSLPAEQIIAAVAGLSPDVLFLTLTMLFLLDDLLYVLDALLRDMPSCKIIVGGRGTVFARVLLESKGAMVAKDFDHGHQMALNEVGYA